MPPYCSLCWHPVYPFTRQSYWSVHMCCHVNQFFIVVSIFHNCWLPLSDQFPLLGNYIFLIGWTILFQNVPMHMIIHTKKLEHVLISALIKFLVDFSMACEFSHHFEIFPGRFFAYLGFPQLFKNCLLQPTLAQLPQIYFQQIMPRINRLECARNH